MANETWIKPHDVTVGAVSVKKVDRIDHDDGAEIETFFGDNAKLPTVNRANQSNPKLTITTRDYASYNSLPPGTAGSVTFSFEDTAGGADIPKTFSNAIVIDRRGVWGGKINAGTIVFGVESSDGQAGGLSS
jgi:hypothetical protein